MTYSDITKNDAPNGTIEYYILEMQYFQDLYDTPLEIDLARMLKIETSLAEEYPHMASHFIDRISNLNKAYMRLKSLEGVKQ